VVVVDLVVAAAVTLVGAASRAAVGSMLADKLQVVLAPAEVASALGACAAEAVSPTLRALDPDFLRLGVLRTRSLSPVLPRHKFRVQLSQGSRISAPLALETTL
jgi:hypothetical protein